MTAFLRWSMRKVGAGALLQVSLGALTLWCVAFGLADVVQSLDLSDLSWSLLAGLLAAWLAARSRMKGAWASLLLIGSGFGFVLLIQGQLVGPLIVWFFRLVQYGAEEIQGILGKNLLAADPTLLSLAAGDLQSQVSTLIHHFNTWLTGLSSGGNKADALVSSMMWGIVLWLVSAWAAWYIRRAGKALLAFVPSTALLAGVLNFARPNPYILIPMVILVFLLVIILEQQKREQHWDREKIDYTPEIRWDIAFVAIPVMLAVLGLASLTPSISIGKIVELSRRLFQNQTLQVGKVGQALGLKQGAGSEYFTRGQTASTLPQKHLIGSGPELSRQIVMEIRVKESQTDGKTPEQLYWRSLIYDQYTGSGWTSSPTRVVNYAAGDQSIPTSVADRRVIEQDVHWNQAPDGLLYHTGELVSADQDYQVAWRLPLEPDRDAFGASTGPGDYTTKSLLPLVSRAELRLAGVDYPDWVKERYLKLPATIPERVSQLADKITQGQLTPYDKAFAIQSFLRSYTYTLDISAPPADQDIADYFLFDLKKGYCDYYATAMVVLARLEGVPARFVTGFAAGKYDPNSHTYIVSEAEAHSWVEVYFPRYGWIEFEPTAGRPAIQLPESLPPIPQTAPLRALPITAWLTRLNLDLPRVAVGVASLIVLLGLGWLVSGWFRLRVAEPAQVAGHIYRRFHHATRLLDAQRPPGETPIELSRVVAAQLETLQERKLLSGLFKPAVQDVESIVSIFNQTQFSPHPLVPEQKAQMIKAWERTGWRLRLAGLWGKIWRPAGK